MIHAPARPSWNRRIPAYVAMSAALCLKALPEGRRMRARITLTQCTRALPPAGPVHVRQLYQAVLACQPPWWRGQIDCKERALATVLACALTGRHCRLVLGARTLPAAFHAWVATADGTEIGNEEAGGRDHPWTAVYTTL
ncbi:lasso peptide biosynthesis B2 protein [Streptomyces klenkii]|uniref:lasso peptide biosynthesis B2 protein n=1 Tax=Streptomyces klenkii TaxID=1420899 RepID=UPI003427A600